MLPLTLRLMGRVVFAGEMQGTVHRSLLETHQNELKPGSVLLLKQVWGAALPARALEEAPQAVCVASSLAAPRQGAAGLVLGPGFLDLNPSSGVGVGLRWAGRRVCGEWPWCRGHQGRNRWGWVAIEQQQCFIGALIFPFLESRLGCFLLRSETTTST